MTGTRLTESVVFIRLAFALPGRVRQLNGAGAEVADSIGAQRERIKTTANLFSGEAFAKIVSARGAVKAEVLKLAIPIEMDFRGAYVLPRALLERVEEMLSGARRDDAQRVEDFIFAGGYAAEVERSRRELGSAFNAADYPAAEVLRGQFGMGWRYFAIEVPEDLPAEVRERESAKLQSEIEAVAADCRNALRTGLADLVAHLVDRLAPAADGKQKRLASTTVENLREFLDTLSLRDITGDTDIRALADKARAVLAGASAEVLRENRPYAEKIRSGLQTVQAEISALVKTAGARKFDFADDDAPAVAGAAA